MLIQFGQALGDYIYEIFVAKFDFWLAFGLIAGLRDCGLRVPEDISIVGIDDLYLCSLFRPALTSLRPPRDVMARKMVERVIARIADPSLPVGEFLFERIQITQVTGEKARAGAADFWSGAHGFDHCGAQFFGLGETEIVVGAEIRRRA